MNKEQNTFGQWLREQRTAKSVGLRTLASSTSISATYLSRIENGHEKAPSDRVLIAIAVQLQIKPSLIFKMADRVPVAVQRYILNNDALLISLIDEVADAEQ